MALNNIERVNTNEILVCIDNTHVETILTIGKKYLVHSYSYDNDFEKSPVRIKPDGFLDGYATVSRQRFITLEEIREQKINEILE